MSKEIKTVKMYCYHCGNIWNSASKSTRYVQCSNQFCGRKISIKKMIKLRKEHGLSYFDEANEKFALLQAEEIKKRDEELKKIEETEND